MNLCDDGPGPGAGAGEVHVVPVFDLVEHESVDDCMCGPTVQAVPRGDGTFRWVVQHHSLDGREFAGG